MNNEQALDAFLSTEQRPAFRMAQISTGSRDDALDIVQDAMIKFVEKYGHKDEASWKPLFYRVVNTRIIDWHRRKKVRTNVMGWFSGEDDIESAAEDAPCPEQQNLTHRAIDEVDAALKALPLRQQQAVLLRLWDGMDTKETAIAMGVSTGSVKTHYFRGLKALQARLGEHWP